MFPAKEKVEIEETRVLTITIIVMTIVTSCTLYYLTILSSLIFQVVYNFKAVNSVFQSYLITYSFKMATLRKKQKLALVARKCQEEHPKNNQSGDTVVNVTQKAFITQVSEEIELEVTNSMSQEFKRTKRVQFWALPQS